MAIPYRAAGSFTGESYVEREADTALLREIERNNRYPYLLAPRQSGKSSLLARTRQILQDRDMTSFFIDLQGLPHGVRADYAGFLEDISWLLLEQEGATGYAGDLSFLKQTLEYLLEKHLGRIVIFIDEVDLLLTHPSKDSFFGLIRSFFNLRSFAPAQGFERIQFVLSGAARPEDLIAKPNQSPFNVGIPIVLSDLDESGIEKMLVPMQTFVDVSPGVAKCVYFHTEGSVYLSQLILERAWNLIQDHSISQLTCEHIDEVADFVVSNAKGNVHFRTIARSFTDRPSRLQALQPYLDGELVSEDDRSYIEMTGLVRAGRAWRNRIYSRVFIGNGAFPLVAGGTQRDLFALFSPSAPQTNGNHWQPSDRQRSLDECTDALRREAIILVITGERGVGKTTFARNLLKRLMPESPQRSMARSPSDGSRQTICMWYSCSELLRDEEDLSYGLLNARSSGLSLRELFPKKLHELGVFDRVSEERAPQFYRHKLESLLQEISERERTKLVVFLDDFDMVRDAESIGNFIKRMDFVRFVIIGNTFRSLSLFENKSLQRRLRRVELQPLSQHDVNSWLDFIERSSGNALTFSRDFRNMIYKESRGVPWILQRLSYETATLAAQSQLTDHVVVDSESLSAIALGLVTRGELPPPNRLRELREMLGLTRADLARLSDVSDKTIARVESSQRGIREVTYRRILNGLNMGRNRRGLASLSFDSLFKENE